MFGDWVEEYKKTIIKLSEGQKIYIKDQLAGSSLEISSKFFFHMIENLPFFDPYPNIFPIICERPF